MDRALADAHACIRERCADRVEAVALIAQAWISSWKARALRSPRPGGPEGSSRCTGGGCPSMAIVACVGRGRTAMTLGANHRKSFRRFRFTVVSASFRLSISSARGRGAVARARQTDDSAPEIIGPATSIEANTECVGECRDRRLAAEL